MLEEEMERTPVEDSHDGSRPPIARTAMLSEPPRSMAETIGASKPLRELYRTIDRVADTGCTILVTGESGTGKELVARAVHDASDRASQPFVAVNCGAIPEALLESELFGHSKGAFTGAHATRQGRIALAAGGTLFLDEIGEMPMALQVKLLRVLQSRDYSPVGDSRVVKADVRVVAATNVDLEQAVREGTFREDLFYRLNVIHVLVPALRDRREDIAELACHFLELNRAQLGRPQVQAISPAAMRVLNEYDWPGNVRELANYMERAVLLCRSETIEPHDLPPKVCGLATEPRSHQVSLPEAGIDLRDAVRSYENQLIRQALDRCKWNKKRAADLLGLNRTTLVEMLRRRRINKVA